MKNILDKMTELNDFGKILLDLKIDFSKIIILRLRAGSIYSRTQLGPKDFIRFAKLDFAAKDKRGLANSLTNAKRAIDCQIDNALLGFGIDPYKLEKASESLVNMLELNQKNLPFKLKVIQSLGLAPGNLTAKVRNLRNKLEHYYEIPTVFKVEEAIEIAELFILSIESKTKMIDDEFILSSSNFKQLDVLKDMKAKKYNILDPKHYATQLLINFNSYHRRLQVTPVRKSKNGTKIILKVSDPLYYYFIRIMNHLDEQVECEEDIKLLLKHCGHPLPEEHVAISEYY